jgi:hypothetical protein
MSTLQAKDSLSGRIKSSDHCQMMIITPDRDYDGDQRVNDSADDKDYDPAPIVTPPPNHGLRRFKIKTANQS